MGAYLDAVWTGSPTLLDLQDMVEATWCVDYIASFATKVSRAKANPRGSVGLSFPASTEDQTVETPPHTTLGVNGHRVLHESILAECGRHPVVVSVGFGLGFWYRSQKERGAAPLERGSSHLILRSLGFDGLWAGSGLGGCGSA